MIGEDATGKEKLKFKGQVTCETLESSNRVVTKKKGVWEETDTLVHCEEGNLLTGSAIVEKGGRTRGSGD